MTLALQILGAAMIAASGAFVWRLDYHAQTDQDKPNKRLWYKKAAIALALLSTIFTIVSTITNHYDQVADQKSAEQAVKDSASMAEKNADARQATVMKMLDPVVRLAESRHPGVTTEQAIELLIADVKNLEERTKPRRIAIEDHRAILLALGNFSPKPARTVIWYDVSDSEAKQYAMQFAELLSGAGWSVQPVGSMDMEIGPPVISVASLDKDRAASEFLSSTLTKHEIQAITVSPSSLDTSWVSDGPILKIPPKPFR